MLEGDKCSRKMQWGKGSRVWDVGTGKTAVLIGVLRGPHWEADLQGRCEGHEDVWALGTFFPGREPAVGMPWGRCCLVSGKSSEVVWLQQKVM